MGKREKGWIDSDLVGILATVYSFGVLVVSLALFRYASPLAGIVVAVGLWVPMLVFAIRERGYPPAALEIARRADGPRHRVLVIANRRLEDPALCERVCRRSGGGNTEAMIFAPVVAASRLREIANDVDRELGLARTRLDTAIEALSGAGVRAAGRTDIAAPAESLLDGLREYPANEIVMLREPGGDWEAAAALAERARLEAGLAVSEVG
jgi:hypothetical protein